MVSQPLQTRLILLFTNNLFDVTEDIMPDLLDFSYDDKETNEADEVSLTLKDETGKWAKTWKPDGGEVVRAYIKPGTAYGALRQLYCGKFYVDTLGVSGSPRIFTIRAVSIPLNKPIRKKLKSKAWEKNTLKGIAEEIAKAAGIKLIFDSSENPSFDRQDQSAESDLKFLSRLCEDAGLSLKFTDDTIVIFDQASYEKKAPIKTLELGVSDILSWDFEQAQSDTYKSCTVTYRDPKKKVKGKAGGYGLERHTDKLPDSAPVVAKGKATNSAVLSYTYVDPDADENGQEYELKKRAKSLDDAKRLAKSTLRGLNMHRVTGNMTLVGDVSLLAGVVVECRGFGSFDGNFIVEQATHTVNTGGYTTSISLRRVNNAY